MTASARFFARLLTLAAVALLATAASSQTAKYNPATETTFKGVVDQLKLVPPSGGKPVVYLVLKSNPSTGEVFLCPKRFLDDIGVSIKADDAVEVTGSKVKQDGEEVTLAREVVLKGETLTLRFKDGKPAW
jgi:hypothetical protein